MIESALDRIALENRCYDTGSGVKEDEDHYPTNSAPEPFLWEDADIEQQD